jgi:heme oxygenase
MVVTLLREHTRLLHDRVENAVDLPSRCGSLESYRELLSRLLGFYAPLEAQLSPFDWGLAGLNFEARRKAALLRADLASLGLATISIDSLASCRKLPRPASLAGAIGCLYVLEGATLGGQVIARQVSRSLGVGPSTGGRFFYAHGEETGSLWRAFGAAAGSYCGEAEDRIAAAVAAAVATFEAFETWLTAGEGEGERRGHGG